jgi:hypothetical protein
MLLRRCGDGGAPASNAPFRAAFRLYARNLGDIRQIPRAGLGGTVSYLAVSYPPQAKMRPKQT